MQGPSLSDQNKASSTSYVFEMRAGVIYIYNNTGVVASLPCHLQNQINQESVK